jgi:hypothetical protein
VGIYFLLQIQFSIQLTVFPHGVLIYMLRRTFQPDFCVPKLPPSRRLPADNTPNFLPAARSLPAPALGSIFHWHPLASREVTLSPSGTLPEPCAPVFTFALACDTFSTFPGSYFPKSYKELLTMEWTTPQHEEIDLNCEVSSYANAEL